MARRLAALKHPNVAQVYGIGPGDPSTALGQERRAAAIAMGFAEGRGLDEINVAIPLDELLPIPL